MQAQDKPRRQRVVKHTGVWFRDTAAGRRYEITFLDATGKRRWKTVDGGLREAQAALDAARQRTTRGERTAPSQAPRVADYADEWLARKTKLRGRTREKYEINLRVHVKPRLGRFKISDVREDDVARLVREMETAGYAGATIQGVLVALGGMLNAAVRDGFLPSNPLHRLQREERPTLGRKEKRVLDGKEIGRLLDAAPSAYRAFLATAAFAGLRLSELLGLKWSDMDFENGLLHGAASGIGRASTRRRRPRTRCGR
jgi:integrase